MDLFIGLIIVKVGLEIFKIVIVGGEVIVDFFGNFEVIVGFEYFVGGCLNIFILWGGMNDL